MNHSFNDGSSAGTIWEVFQSCGCPARVGSQQRGELLYIFGSFRTRLLLPEASSLCRHQKISNLQTISDKSPFCVRGDVQSILNIRQIKCPTWAKAGRFLSPILFPVKDPMFATVTPSALDILFVQKGLWEEANRGKKRYNQKNYWGKLWEDIEKSRYFCTFLPMRYALLTNCRFLELLGWERPSLTSLTILQGPWQPHYWLQVEPAWGHAGY